MNSEIVKSLCRSCEGIGASVSDQAYDGLAQEVDYRTREVIQEALKFAMHAKRKKLSTDDVDRALRLRGAEQTYGHQHGERGVSFAKPRDESTFPGVSFVEDKVHSLEDVLCATEFPALPRGRGVHLHWLAVEGTKPLIPENVRVKRRRKDSETVALTLEAGGPRAKEGGKGAREGVGSEFTVLNSYETNISKGHKHVVSMELQTYFQTVTRAVLNASKASEAEESGIEAGTGVSDLGPALASLGEDPGLQPLLPYFCSFVIKCVEGEEKKSFFSSLGSCGALLGLVQSLVSNMHLKWERHVHQILPVVMTLLVRKTLGGPGDDHWKLRRQAGRVLALMCTKLESEKSQVALQTRVARVLVTKGLMDATKALTSHYGAIVGIYHLGDVVCENVLLPHIATYMPCLGEALTSQTMNPLQQYEAYQCLEAILIAIGRLVHQSEYNQLLGRRQLPSGRSLLGKGGRVEAEGSSKQTRLRGGTPARARRARPAKKKLSVEDLRKTEGGQSVLDAFAVAEPGSVADKDESSLEDAEAQHIDLNFDFELNNFTGMPTFERGNIVSHSFDIFGEHILPFLTNDMMAMML
ncbi:putative TATA box binding protein associated factor [Chloropicon primus]|uniref:Putative TATA box binding protein associated factor n=1 Tax=Chloropicon primus TaxID=1764295 RepID=A0A5B8ME07_9CHLO|nr:putative TATA box binding protein associated factor [Chloropicon primus]UPQ96750.1 putative TATA box binding protein associated factor [Chloropicon primus]|eukprot:QDZ17532.1 putative TATA box binding protein associated factor [Chloropicon primus]